MWPVSEEDKAAVQTNVINPNNNEIVRQDPISITNKLFILNEQQGECGKLCHYSKEKRLFMMLKRLAWHSWKPSYVKKSTVVMTESFSSLPHAMHLLANLCNAIMTMVKQGLFGEGNQPVTFSCFNRLLGVCSHEEILEFLTIDGWKTHKLKHVTYSKSG